jgi:threonine/homoserine/homoserine lactone efflux protein
VRLVREAIVDKGLIMPEASTYLSFVAAAVLMQLTPGPDMMLIISRGIGEGRRIALCTVVGMTAIAGLVQLPLLTGGVISAMAAWPTSLDILRWVGGGYLILLGGSLLMLGRHAGSPAATHAPEVGSWAAIRQGAVSNLTNPKSMLFMLAFLPQFVNPAEGGVTLQLLLLGATQKMTGLLIQSTIAVGAGTIGVLIARHPSLLAWQRRIGGITMIALGLRMLLESVIKA